MENKEYTRKYVPSSSGVALVMVLGLLTVMVILAVTFAVSMRTERLAAGNAADNVRARELVHVGLARAMNQLSADLGPTGLYSPGGKVYPPWSVTNSYTNIGGMGLSRFVTNTYQDLLILKGDATNYIPRALWYVATNADLTSPANHWLAVESNDYTNDWAGVEYFIGSNLMGRVAYLILNCSGLLDANLAGGKPRAAGTNAAEIAIAAMEEAGGGFVSARDGAGGAVRFETLAYLNSAGALAAPLSTNLFVYSYALPGYWSTLWNCAATQINLTQSSAGLQTLRTEIINVFGQAGFSAAESALLYTNLIDYADTNVIPGGEYCVEMAPMINEVAVTNRLTVWDLGGGNYRYQIYGGADIELWYPFPKSANADFKVKFDLTFAEVDMIPPDPPSNIVPGLEPTDSMGVSKDVPNPSPADPFITVSVPYSVSIDWAGYVGTIGFVSRFNNIRIEFEDNVVDQVNGLLCVTNSSDSVAGGPLSATYSASSMQCNDPRFNLDPNNPNQWSRWANSHTLNSLNNGISTNIDNNDGDIAMYIANGPMQSAAELGCLIYSTNYPWTTVKLYGTNLHRVLDAFGCSANTNDIYMTNKFYRGLVNCNPNVATDATAVVFANMPVNQYPDGPVVGSLSMDQARQYAVNMFGGGLFTNLSDIGGNLAPTSFPVANTEFERESCFRNAIGLLNLRQNVFTIIIEAHAASGGNIPSFPAKQRAVAIVWRDPYTGEMAVRHIKWLGD